MKLDEEAIRWLRDEAREDGDRAIARACRRALDGDPRAIATCEETLATKLGTHPIASEGSGDPVRQVRASPRALSDEG